MPQEVCQHVLARTTLRLERDRRTPLPKFSPSRGWYPLERLAVCIHRLDANVSDRAREALVRV